MNVYEIAVVHGDGIGPEVCQAAVDVLNAVKPIQGLLRFTEYQAGAEEYRRSGDAYPEATFLACKAAHAILHGAGGLPDVTYPDGVEAGADFGLRTRFRLDLYANIRPIRLYEGVQSKLRDRKAGEIDYVIVYAARGGGVLLRGDVAADTLVMTRKGVERVCRAAFELARKRNGAPKDGKRRVTCCDKSNVLRSYAFFRKIFDEVAAQYPDIETDYSLAEAMTVHLIEKPDFYDVIVTENMFGDIISDLAAATVGGMGMTPSSELGDEHGFFQAAHGSAPTIAGKGIANPYGSILSASSMLGWLGERHGEAQLSAAGHTVAGAVEAALADGGRHLTVDLGGKARTRDAVDGVVYHLG